MEAASSGAAEAWLLVAQMSEPSCSLALVGSHGDSGRYVEDHALPQFLTYLRGDTRQ